jgi:hypothetical protein
VFATARIINLNGVMQTLALDDAPIGHFPSASAAAGALPLGSDLPCIREAGERIAF